MKTTHALWVCRIPYLNTDPFFAGWDEDSFALISASPRQLGEWAQQGRLDAGPIPLVDCWKLEAEFEPVGNFGIAVKKAAKSVFLFSQKPIQDLEGAHIGVTDQTSTSVKLLEVLLKLRYGLKTSLAPFSEEDEARLVIGDDALAQARLSRFPHLIDLGQEWHDWQKLPFVFARWMVRRTAPAYLKEELRDHLDQSLGQFEKQDADIIGAGAGRLGLPAQTVRDYFSAFTYRLGQNEELAEKTFRDLVTGKANRCLC